MQIFGKLANLHNRDYDPLDADRFLKKGKRSIMIILLLLIPTALIAVFSFSVSLYTMDFGDVIGVLDRYFHGIPPSSYREEILDHLVLDNYVPRAFAGLMVGAILAMGGAVMQSSLRNPLADSYTTGISSGALFGYTVSVILGIGILPGLGEVSDIVNAFAFSLIPTAVILIFTFRRKVTPTAMILIGLGVMYLFSAATTLLKYTADPKHIAQIYEWSVGSLASAGWGGFPILLGATIVMAIAFFFMYRTVNVLSTGENMSVALGVNPQNTRILVLVIVSLCTAAAVCFTGSIGFVGLVIPHVSRIIVGSNLKYLIPTSAVLGAILLVSSDCIARVIGSSGLPVGVITAIIGSPLFLYFLIKQRRNAWQ